MILSWQEIFSAGKWLMMSRDRLQVLVFTMVKVLALTLIFQLDSLRDLRPNNKQTLGTCPVLHIPKLLHTNPLRSHPCLVILKLPLLMLLPNKHHHTMCLFPVPLSHHLPNINHIPLWHLSMDNLLILVGVDHTMVHLHRNQDPCPGLLTPFHPHLLIRPLTRVTRVDITDSNVLFAQFVHCVDKSFYISPCTSRGWGSIYKKIIEH